MYSQDYYSVLEITRDASIFDIQKAYRRLALKYHPQKKPDDVEQFEKFTKLAEAYDILSNLRIKCIYDQFGEFGVKHDLPVGSGEAGAHSEAYTFHGDPYLVFRNFFGSDNPFQEYYDRIDGDMYFSYGGLYGYERVIKNEPIVQDLYLTLEEIYRGTIKQMKYQKLLLNSDNCTTRKVENILTVHIRPGIMDETKIVFNEAGDQGPNQIPADMIYVIKSKHHPVFKRDGINLHHECKLTIGQAIAGHIVKVPTLDDRLLSVPITEVVSPFIDKIVIGEGLPLPSNPSKKGDLFIHFDIQIKTLTSKQRKLIKQSKI